MESMEELQSKVKRLRDINRRLRDRLKQKNSVISRYRWNMSMCRQCSELERDLARHDQQRAEERFWSQQIVKQKRNKRRLKLV